MATCSIIFLGGYLNDPQTGGDQYDAKIYEYLVTSGLNPSFINVVPIRNLISKRLPAFLWRYRFFQQFIVSLIIPFKLIREFNSKKYILIENECVSQALLFFNLYHRYFKKSQIIVIAHHLEYYSRDMPSNVIINQLEGLAVKMALSLAHVVVTVSQFSQGEMVSAGVPSGKITIIPNGLDLAKLTRDNGEKKCADIDQIKLLCVANCAPIKGIEFLIEAFSILKKLYPQNLTLDIVGKFDHEDQYCKRLLKQISEKCLEHCVTFHGRIDQACLNNLYELADIFILPSLKEGFGVVFLEAMFYGLPIVTTNVSAMPELIKDGENGFLVPPRNPFQLAQAVEKLITDEKLRQHIGENNRRRIDDKYSWETSCKLFLDLVNKSIVKT